MSASEYATPAFWERQWRMSGIVFVVLLVWNLDFAAVRADIAALAIESKNPVRERLKNDGVRLARRRDPRRDLQRPEVKAIDSIILAVADITAVQVSGQGHAMDT